MSYELLMRSVAACSFLALGSLLVTSVAVAAANAGANSKLAQCRLLACPATVFVEGKSPSLQVSRQQLGTSIRI